jgi:hypothetical protein
MTLSKDGLILVAEEDEEVTIQRDRKRERWLLRDAWLLDADSVVLAVIDVFYYRSPQFTGGDHRHLIIPDEDVESFTAALRDALVTVNVKP